jgi:hypothetical protein
MSIVTTIVVCAIIGAIVGPVAVLFVQRSRRKR